MYEKRQRSELELSDLSRQKPSQLESYPETSHLPGKIRAPNTASKWGEERLTCKIIVLDSELPPQLSSCNF